MKNYCKTVGSLHSMLIEMSAKRLEIKRIARISYALLSTGCICAGDVNRALLEVQDSQLKDGSWDGSYISTAWCLALLRTAGLTESSCYRKGIDFLLSARGLWGRHPNDMQRIPSTGLILYLLPELKLDENHQYAKRLYNLWLSEEFSLTYKASFFLLGVADSDCEKLVTPAVEWLSSSQEENGAYKPWKNHPIQEGNVVWTSLAILALLPYRSNPVANAAIEKSVNWIQSTQLCNGIWPYHEIDEGISWGHIARYNYLLDTNARA